MISAFQKDQDLIQDIQASNALDKGFRLWWLGQSGFLLQFQGTHLLIDPYLSDSLTAKYAQTEKPHVRMSERVIDPVHLDFIDIVTSSHNHTDHLDRETLLPLMSVNPDMDLIIPEANRAFVMQRLECDPTFPIGLNAGQQLNLKGFRIHGIPAAHNELDQDGNGRYLYLGYIFRFGTWTVYHSGDTLWYEGLEAHLKSFDIDLALLPINGNRPERKVAGNLNAQEAALLGQKLNALVVPCHYHMFEFNTEDPARFVEAAKEYGIRYRVLQPGERLDMHA